MRIISLTTSNTLRLSAVHIQPDGSLVVIGGRNAQGKSSVLNSISMALGGAKLCPPEPVKRGAAKSVTRLDLGELVVERTITADGHNYLKVSNAAGAEQKSPQAILDRLTGKLSFDPLEFSRMAPKQQVETLRALTGLKEGMKRSRVLSLRRRRTLQRRLSPQLTCLN